MTVLTCLPITVLLSALLRHSPSPLSLLSMCPGICFRKLSTIQYYFLRTNSYLYLLTYYEGEAGDRAGVLETGRDNLGVSSSTRSRRLTFGLDFGVWRGWMMVRGLSKKSCLDFAGGRRVFYIYFLEGLGRRACPPF